jgi:hypothetical protein
MVTPLNETREGEVKAGWPGLGLRRHDNHMRNFAFGQEGHVIPSSCHRRSVRLPGGIQSKENRAAKEERHPAMPASSIIIL